MSKDVKPKKLESCVEKYITTNPNELTPQAVKTMSDCFRNSEVCWIMC